MGLQRFERRLERLVEGGFGKAFRRPATRRDRAGSFASWTGRTLGVRGMVV
jgi:hypothetical protein